MPKSALKTDREGSQMMRETGAHKSGKVETLPSTRAYADESAIQGFVLQALERLGAAVMLVEWGVYEVLLPHEASRLITFDVEVAREREDAEFVSVGSPLVEGLMQSAGDWGTVQVRQIDMRVVPPLANAEDKWATFVHFDKCKPPKAMRWVGEQGLLVLMRFHVTYQTDDQVEDLVPILIDATSLADVTALLPALESHWFTVAPPGALGETAADWSCVDEDEAMPLPVSEPFALTDVFAQAVAALQPTIDKKIAALIASNRAQREEELGKSRHYYDETLQTLARQLDHTLDAARRERLEQKIAATKHDRDHRMADISRAYEVSVEVVLDQAILYRAPVLCVEAQVQQRTEMRSFVFRYYPWAGKWSPVVCPVCHSVAPVLKYGEAGWHCGCSRS